MQISNAQIIEKLLATFGSDIIKCEEPYGFLTITADKSKNIDILKFLWNDSDLKFKFMTDLCGVHYPETSQLCVVYHLHSLVKNIRLRLKFYVNVSDPHILTATSIFESANWQERETFDFYGIIFDGHPDLRRILNVDEMEVFPLRKEYPLEDPNRVDKKDYFFGR